MTWIDLRHRLRDLRGQRFHVALAVDEPGIRQALDAEAFHVVTLAGTAIRNEPTFFDELARALALPDWFGRNWDAVTDALGELAEGPYSRVAFLWVDADQSLAADLQTFVAALLALDRAAADFAGSDDPRQLEVFLLGSGAGFPSVP